jgi:hypothetical protein
VDAYRAYRPMPYDAPSHDLAAAHYAVHPDSGFFQLSDAGSLTVANDGNLRFTVESGGRIRSLKVDPAQKDKIIQAFVEITSAKPIQPQRRPPVKKDQ